MDIKAQQEKLIAERDKLNKQIKVLEHQFIELTQKDLTKKWVGKCFKINKNTYCKIIRPPQIAINMTDPTFYFNSYQFPTLFINTSSNLNIDFPVYVDTLFITENTHYEEITPNVFACIYDETLRKFEDEIIFTYPSV